MEYNSISPISTPHVQGTSSAPLPSSFTPSKPALSRLIQFHTSFGKLGDKSANLTLNRLEREYTELQFWSKEQIEQKMQQSWTDWAWSSFAAASNACISIFNFYAGYSIGTASIAGTALIASGVFDILQILFKQYGTWDSIAEMLADKNQDLKERLKKELPFLLSLLNLACSSLGAQGLTTQLTERLQSLRAALSGLAQVGNVGFSISQGHSAVESSKIQTELKKHEQNSELLLRLVEALLEESKRIKSAIKKPIYAQLQAGVLAAQKIYR